MDIRALALKLIIFIGIGFLARRIKAMPDGFDAMLSKFLMTVPLPCMIVNSFRLEFTLDRLLSCPVLIGLAVLTIALCFAFGEIIRRALGGGVGKAARFGLIFTNFTFFGFAIVSELYGDQALFYYVIFTLPIRIMFYGGAPLLLGEKGAGVDVKSALRQFICAPVIGVFVGLILYITQLPLPNIVSEVITTLGNMASPLGLMLCGAIIADAKWKGILKYPCVFWLSALRLAVVPAAMLGIMLLLRVDSGMIKPIMFFFATPVASFLPTFLLRYNPSEVEGRSMGSFFVVVSTTLSIATVPLWALVLERI